MVDKVLAVLYRPDFMQGFVGLHHLRSRFDADCMAVVLLLLRLVYRLDDSYEL